MGGWIKIHRKIQNHWLWQEKRKFSKFEAWISLLLKANHTDTKVLIGNEIIDVKAGSFITSEVKLSEEWNWSRNTTRKFLMLLKNEKMLNKICTANYTTISIENWALYQFKGQEVEQQSEQQSEQVVNSGLNTDKNIKNIKEVEEVVKEKTDDEKNYLKCYMENINPLITPYEIEILNSYTDDLEEELIIKAIQDAVAHNVRTLAYVKSILNRYVNQGISKLEQLNILEKQKEIKKDESNKQEYTFSTDDLTEEQLDRYLNNKMTKEELIKILEAKNV